MWHSSTSNSYGASSPGIFSSRQAGRGIAGHVPQQRWRRNQTAAQRTDLGSGVPFRVGRSALNQHSSNPTRLSSFVSQSFSLRHCRTPRQLSDVVCGDCSSTSPLIVGVYPLISRSGFRKRTGNRVLSWGKTQSGYALKTIKPIQ